jgi:aryl-alcohol dehydrogenase-like predicted oxidoreductase
MEKRSFGKSGVEASVVGFGVWTVSTPWWHASNEKLKDRDYNLSLLQKALDAGITLFDTADTYGNGLGETILKDALGHRRDEICISTKFGYEWQNTPVGERKGQVEQPQNFDPDFIRKGLEGALERLGTDRIDLWMLHNAKMDHIERDDTFALLEKLKQEGKIRAYGVALGPAIGWEPEGVKAMQTRALDCLMIIYNLLEQDPGRRFIEVAGQSGCGLMARVPHSSGMLEGQYTNDTKFDASDHRAHRKRVWLEQGLQKVEQLKFLTEGKGRTLAQVALQYILAHKELTACLPNIYNEAQLAEFTAAPATTPLTAEEIAKVDALFDANFGLPLDKSTDKVPVSR